MLALVPMVAATAGVSAGIEEITVVTVGTLVVVTDIRVEAIVGTSVVVTDIRVQVIIDTSVAIAVTTAVLVVIDIALGVIIIIIRVVMAIHMHLAILLAPIHLIDPGTIHPVLTQAMRLLLATLV